ncbi:MAG: hypothetical protein WCG80_07880 [Spirochaetales bacterium]
MTITFRNRLLTLLLIVTFLLAGSYLAASYLAAVVLQLPEQELLTVLDAGPSVVVGLAGVIWLRRVYRKTSAPTVFFFTVFLFCVTADGLRVAQVFLTLAREPFSFGLLVTKTVWALRLGSLFSLLFASLFLLDFSYEGYGTLLLAGTAACVLLVVGLPLQSSLPDAHGLYPLGDTLGLALFFGLILLVATANHALAWWKDHRSEASADAGRRIPLLMVVWVLVAGGWLGGLLWNPWWLTLMAPGIVLLGQQARDTLL